MSSDPYPNVINLNYLERIPAFWKLVNVIIWPHQSFLDQYSMKTLSIFFNSMESWSCNVFFVCFFLLLYIYTPLIPHTLQADTLQKCNNVITYQKLGPICCGLKWFYLPVNVVLISRMAKLCRTIRTTLSDNWKLLVRPMKLAVETSSCLCIKVKSQESIVKSQKLREKSQESRVKNQESRVKSQE